MKKVFMMLIAMLLVLPVVVFAANTQKIEIPDETTENNGIITTTDPEDENKVTKKFPVYLVQTEEAEVSSVTISISETSNAIKSFSFEGTTPYAATKDGNKGTFAVGEGVTGSSSKRIQIGYVVLQLNQLSDDCSFTATLEKTNGVKTGDYLNYFAIGAGVLLIAGIYVSTRSKKKLFNI